MSHQVYYRQPPYADASPSAKKTYTYIHIYIYIYIAISILPISEDRLRLYSRQTQIKAHLLLCLIPASCAVHDLPEAERIFGFGVSSRRLTTS